MNSFHISFEFVDNLGTDTITRAERRWNGLYVVISKSKFAKMTTDERRFVLLHECEHAIVECSE